MIIVPAYGKDYKTRAEVTEAWNEGRDFKIQDVSNIFNGKYVNKTDLENYAKQLIQNREFAIKIRYNALTMFVFLHRDSEGKWNYVESDYEDLPEGEKDSGWERQAKWEGK